MSFISQEAVRVVNTVIDIFNMTVLLGIFIHACFKLNRSHEKKVFLILLNAAFAYNLGDMANWTCEGFAHPWNVPVLHIFTFMSFVAGPLIYVIFMRLVRVSYKDKFESNKYYFLCLFSCGLSVLMGFLSCFPGFLYYFDANNVYHRTQFHIIVSINTLLYYLFSILYICSCRKKITKKEFLILLSFPSFPVLMYVPQIIFYGIATLNVGITISILIIYKAVLRKMKLEIVNSKKSFTSEFFVKQNVTFWERIRRSVFYYGYSEGAINSVKQELSENVSYTLKFVSLCVVLMNTFLFSHSFIIPSLYIQRHIYLLTLLISLILYLVLVFQKKSNPGVIILSFLFIISVYGLNMYKSLILTPNELPLLFCCILFIVPSVFCYMPHMISFLNFSAIFIYMDLAKYYKPEGAHLDSTYLIFITVLGIVIGYANSKTKIKSLYLSKNLDKEINAKTKQLNGISDQIVKTIVYSIETKDENTKGHAEKVADYAVKIGRRLRWQDQKCTELWLSAILHDVGKIGIPDDVLKKGSSLTDEDYEIIKKHTEYGEKILQNLTYYPKARVVARSHHERFDGTGYPDGLAGKDIPIEARIVAIADAFVAMSSRRSHRDKLSIKKIIEELINGKSTQFDPELIDVFLNVLDDEEN